MSHSILVDERLADEVEAIRAILLEDEYTIIENDSGVPQEVETLVFPSTGEDELSKYVCVKLIVKLPTGYPDVAAQVSLKNPRGLDENTIGQIQLDVEDRCRDLLGQPVIFELIEIVKDHLTKSNLPTGQCVVCLYGFREQDQFVKTECFHYFHSHCLAEHLACAEATYNEEQAKLPQWQKNGNNGFRAYCPVCREPISADVESLKLAPPPADLLEMSNEFSVTEELQEMQQKMQELFLYQQKRGGIIDIKAEEDKLLVMTETDEQGSESQASVSGVNNRNRELRQKKSNNHHSNLHENNHQQHHHHHHHHHNRKAKRDATR